MALPNLGATLASVSAVGGLLSSGPASALSAVGNVVSGFTSSLGSLFKPIPGVKLPLPNPLFAYASYDYVLGIGVLTDAQLANPDATYMKNQRIPLICKSANSDPKNRVQTAFGEFDFFIDKLDMQTTIGLENGNNTNVMNMSFTIVEPYSMGMFLMSLQKAAWDSGHDNYLDAPYLLTIDFRGNTETGRIDNIANTSRKIPFKFRTAAMNVTEKGSVYQCEVYPTNSPALGAQHSQLKSDVSIQGRTVQEVLQTGEKSLQVVLNTRTEQLKKAKQVLVPDEYLILFPTDTASGGTAQSNDTKETKTAATTSGKTMTNEALAKQLDVSRSPKNKTLVQTDAACNALGKAKLGFGTDRKGDAPAGKDNKVYDAGGKVNVRGNNIIDPTTGDYRFSQNTDVINAINQVLLNSDYVKDALLPANISKEGYRSWWRIQTQVYHFGETQKSTGVKPKLIVYQIVPYNTHASKMLPANTPPPGIPELKKQAVKEYNYIYTGKNADIISFNLDFKIGFAAVMGAATNSNSQDIQTAGQASGTDKPQAENRPMPEGSPVEKIPGHTPTQVRYIGTDFKTDNKGGGGLESQTTRAARMFHDAITSGADMLTLDLKIIGDPYFIAQSGQGNYTSTQSSHNLNTDGSVNYQNGEVDIVVNFRTPVDLNQSTGLYDFGKSSKSAPVIQWSGAYQVLNVQNSFAGGQFTQTLSGPRRLGQELSATPDPKKTFNSQNVAPPGTPNNGWGEG